MMSAWALQCKDIITLKIRQHDQQGHIKFCRLILLYIGALYRLKNDHCYLYC